VTRPKVVVTEELGVVRDADVKVSAVDPNHDGDKGEVRVRRSDFVKINMAAWEEQQRLRREEKRYRRQLDPYRLGHWGPTDEDD